MQEADIKSLAEKTLKSELSTFGLEKIDLDIAADPDGSEYLDIVVHYAATGRLPTPQASIAATHLLRRALLAQGEERFPSVVHVGSVEAA